MYTIEDPREFRNKIAGRLFDILTDRVLARNVEVSIHNHAVRRARELYIPRKWTERGFVVLYADRLRSVLANLGEPGSDTELAGALKTGAMTVRRLEFASHEDMCPGRWKPRLEARDERAKQRFEPTLQASTDTQTCSRCKSTKCHYYQLQTRSADEPMTTYYTCLNCGKRWKC